MADWYLSFNGQSAGPFDDETVRAKLASGDITARHLIWTETYPDWVQVSESPEWSSALQTHVTRPPQPPPSPGVPLPAGTGTVSSGQTHPLAIASLVLAIAGLVMFGFLSAIPAVVCGHMALKAIRLNPSLQGRGLAIAGLWIGYITTVLTALAIIGIVAALAIPAFTTARDSAQEAQCLNHQRMLTVAAQMWAIGQNQPEGSQPSRSDLESYLDGYPECPSGGSYTVEPVGEDDAYCSYHGALLAP